MSSILTDTKKMLGIAALDTSFDADIIMHINTVFMVLTQLGVGPDDGFEISDDTTKWTDYVTGKMLNPVKSYMYAKVRMIFDPPTSGAVTEALNHTIAELEFRLNVEVENMKYDEEQSEDDPDDDTASQEDIDNIIDSLFGD